MTTTKANEYAGIGSFMVAFFMLLYVLWPEIMSPGNLFSKFAFGFVCLSVVFAAMALYHAHYHALAEGSAVALHATSPRRRLARGGLVGLIGGLAILVGVVFYKGFQSPSLFRSEIPIVKFPRSSFDLTEVRHRKYVNEKVPLDGFHYVDCEFTNVTFIYNGTAPAALDHDKLIGNWGVYTDSHSVFATAVILKGLGMVKEDAPLLMGPEREPLEIHVPQPGIEPSPSPMKSNATPQ